MKRLTKLLCLALAALLCCACSLEELWESIRNAPAGMPSATGTPLVTAEPTQAPTEMPTEAPTEAAAEAPTEAPVASNPDDVLATVNDEPLTRGAYELFLDDVCAYYSEYGYDVTSEDLLPTLKAIALETGLKYLVRDQKMVELGITLTEEERSAAENEARTVWADTVSRGLSYYGVTDESTDEEVAAIRTQVLAELEQAGYTEESHVEQVIREAGYSKLEEYLLSDVSVSAQDVQDKYDELVAADEAAFKDNAAAYEQTLQMNQLALEYGLAQYYTELYYMPTGYRGISHILLKVDEALMTAYTDLQASYEEQQSALEEGEEVTGELVTEEQVAAAKQAILDSVKAKTDEIYQKLADGTAFLDLIVEYGTDPGMQNETQRTEGYNVHMDSIMWDPAFTQAAFSVDNVGDVTQPVVGQNGVHILQYVRDVPGGPVELTDTLRTALEEELLNMRKSEKLNDTLDTWLSEAKVTYSEEALNILPATVDQAE